MHTLRYLYSAFVLHHGALLACFASLYAAFFVASFEADAAEGLSYIHGKGIVHCDVKLDNTLVCRSNGPAGYVGKITDLGLWCGESGFGSTGGILQDARNPSDLFTPYYKYETTAATFLGQMINT